MIKRFTHAVIAVLLAFSGVAVVAANMASSPKAPRSREEVAKIREERRLAATARPQSVTPKAMIMAGDKQLYGIHCEIEDYSSTGYGIVKIGDNSYSWVKRFSKPVFQGCYMGDKYLVVYYNSINPGGVSYTYYDPTTWNEISNTDYPSTTTNILPYGLTYDHTTNVVYGCFYQGTTKWMEQDDARFGYVTNDPANPTHIVGELPERMRALATDKDGQIYGIALSGALYKINKFTAEAEKLMDMDIPNTDPDLDDNSEPWSVYGRESIAVDWETGYWYFAYGDNYDDTYIARIDINTGSINIIADNGYYGNESFEAYTGLYFINKMPSTGVTPALVSDLALEPLGTQLSANVTFTLPNVDTDGNPLSGTLKWRVTNGSSDLTSGEAKPGEAVSTSVTFSARGFNTAVVYSSLDGAESAGVSASKWIGPDTPVISGRPTLSSTGKRVTISWNAPTSEHNGALDPVRYRIVRMPDNYLVTDQCTETRFVDNIESDYKERYYYNITPIAGEVEGATVESRAKYIGTYFRMPFTEDFSDSERFQQYPISDNNQDDNIWDINVKRGAAVYQGNSNSADDYFLVGPFRMKAGGMYSFYMLAGGHSITEQIVVYTAVFKEDGRAAIDDFIPVTTLNPITEGDKTFNKLFVPKADNDYYFAIGACSGANSQFIYVYDVAVNEYTGELPSTPENLKFVPAATTATIKFTMPSKNIDGTPVNGLTEARIYRDGNFIGNVTDGIAAGAQLSYTDTDNVSDGNHVYSVSAVSVNGESPRVEITCYRGLDFPGTPTDLRFWEDLETPGLIHMTFKAPEYGYNGGYINPDDITYRLDYLVGGESGDVELGKGTTHTFQLQSQFTAQAVFGGSIYGANSAGSLRQSWRTNVCTVGPAVGLPLEESWSEMSQKSGVWAGQAIADEASFDSFWNISDGGIHTIKPQDNDGGMLVLANTVEGNLGHRILSPRITLDGTENPTAVFYYQYTTDAIEGKLEIIVEDEVIRTLRSFDVNENDANQWIRCEVPLKEFVGKKYIQLAFSGIGSVADAYFAIDNVTISDFVDSDLAVRDFTAPVRVGINEEVSFNLQIRNNGSSKVAGKDYSIRFYKNGEMTQEIQGRDIEASSILSFELIDIPTVTDPSSSVYNAEIVYSADNRTDNNRSRNVSVRIVTPDYPTVTDLEGESIGGVTLTWSDPSTSDMPGTPVTESFEAYEAFVINNIGEWTLYDEDGRSTVILTLLDGPLDYDNIGSPMAWQVFDPTLAAIPFEAWAPRTGSNMLVSFQACINGGRNIKSEDWLVSPELNGSEQTVSFYSRAGMSAYSPELFDFMVSSASNAIADFKPLASDVEVPYTSGLEWTEYTYKVPAGTRYFAIVHKSTNKLAMLVDDITYVPAGSQPLSLELQGFNIYRDGKRLNDEPIVDNEYVDSETVKGRDYTYAVTAVWDKGESGMSNSVTVTATSSIDGVSTYELRITAVDGGIRIEGGVGEQVQVYNVAGLCIADKKAEGTIFVPVPASGLYIVKAGSSVAKLVVR
jgi:hypothetical protein